MANQFVEKEVKKIIDQTDLEFPKNLALASAWIIANYKGINIKVVDVRGTSSLCDYNIIATATNAMQARTMIDEVQHNIKLAGSDVLSCEGVDSADWILLDMGDIIVHVFQELTREVYDLDALWEGQELVQIPSEYYFAAPEMDAPAKSDSAENYF